MNELLAHFRLCQLLGEGGMGAVYKAIDTRDGKPVALKVLSHQSLLDEELKRRFLREASAGSKLNHPNIVKVFEVGEADGEHYISMELIEGRTLQTVLKDGPMSPVQVVCVGIAVGEALREAHKAGIVHRDIKSANIMMTPSGQVKVMDFGLAKIQNASLLTHEGQVMGTYTYMSPEQASGETVDHRTDIFSLGVVLYELLTAKLPFGDAYELAVVYSILNVEPVSICDSYPDVPGALETIIFKALRKDLQHRYQNVEELLGDLRRMKAFLEGKRDSMPSGLELVAGADLEDSAEHPAHLTAGAHVGFEPRLAGREEELETLKALVRKADAGEGQTIFLSGEAGIGKTRLATELEKYCRTIKIRPVNTQCAFREGNYPYRPMVHAVRDILSARGLASAESMEEYFRTQSAAFLPYLPVVQLFLNVKTGGTEALQSKDQLWEAILRLFDVFARERTLFLFVDDLQWADEDTLRLIQYLGRNTSHMPVVIVGTYRSEDVSGSVGGRTHPLCEVERQMLQEGCLTVIRLKRLREAGIQQMISSLFACAEFGNAFFEQVYRESEGNPLFVVEIMKLLKAEGAIQSEAGIYRLHEDYDATAIPSRIQDIVVRRVAKLERREREILEIGAVEGEVFHSETISHCLDANRLNILRALQSLERDYHIIHAQEKVYRFDHGKIREALYESITPELRVEYHKMVGQFLADRYGNDEQLASNIAHHFLEGGEDCKALPFLVVGAERARIFFANLQAIHFYERALNICRTMGPTAAGEPKKDKMVILEGLGDVCRLVGNNHRALEAYQELLSIPDLAPVKRAGARQRIGQVYLSEGDNDKALAFLVEAEDVLGSVNASSEHPAEADGILGKTAVTKARIFKSRGEYDEAIRMISEGLKLLGNQEHLRERADAFNDLGNIFEDRSEYKSAEEMFKKSLSLREEIADKKGIAVTYNNLANIFCAQGDYANAAAMFQKSLTLMKEIGFRAGIAGICNNLGTIYQDQGRYQDSLEMLRRGLRVREEIEDRPGIAMSYGNLGLLHLDMGEYVTARDYLQRSIDLQQEIGMKTLLSATMAWLGLAQAELGDLNSAIEIGTKALVMASDMHQRWFEGIAHRSLGVILMKTLALAASAERTEALFEEARRHLSESLNTFDAGKFEHEAGRSSLELARLLKTQGRIMESESYCTRALDVFQKLGAMGDLERARALANNS